MGEKRTKPRFLSRKDYRSYGGPRTPMDQDQHLRSRFNFRQVYVPQRFGHVVVFS